MPLDDILKLAEKIFCFRISNILQRPDKLLEILAMLFAVTIGDFNAVSSFIGVALTVK